VLHERYYPQVRKEFSKYAASCCAIFESIDYKGEKMKVKTYPRPALRRTLRRLAIAILLDRWIRRTAASEEVKGGFDNELDRRQPRRHLDGGSSPACAVPRRIRPVYAKAVPSRRRRMGAEP
jgi:hypothetical protein